jgi:hypothetical protein
VPPGPSSASCPRPRNEASTPRAGLPAIRRSHSYRAQSCARARAALQASHHASDRGLPRRERHRSPAGIARDTSEPFVPRTILCAGMCRLAGRFTTRPSVACPAGCVSPSCGDCAAHGGDCAHHLWGRAFQGIVQEPETIVRSARVIWNRTQQTLRKALARVRPRRRQTAPPSRLTATGLRGFLALCLRARTRVSLPEECDGVCRTDAEYYRHLA